MRTFKIPVYWELKGVVVVEAEDIDEACSIVKSDDTPMPTGYYVEDSYMIDWDVLSETEGY